MRHDALSGSIARRATGRAIDALAPTVAVISEQPYTSRAGRRHARTETGAVVNIPKAKQAPGLNEPYRKPAAA